MLGRDGVGDLSTTAVCWSGGRARSVVAFFTSGLSLRVSLLVFC